MIRKFDMNNEFERKTGLTSAAAAAKRGDLVVFPTDTVYGLGTDAFSKDRKSTRLNSSHEWISRMPSSA